MKHPEYACVCNATLFMGIYDIENNVLLIGERVISSLFFFPPRKCNNQCKQRGSTQWKHQSRYE